MYNKDVLGSQFLTDGCNHYHNIKWQGKKLSPTSKLLSQACIFRFIVMSAISTQSKKKEQDEVNLFTHYQRCPHLQMEMFEQQVPPFQHQEA